MDKNKNPIEGISIVTLELPRWREYREIRLDALQTDPQAFLSTYARESAWPEEKWISRLQETYGSGSWMLFAQNREQKLLGMIGGYRDADDLKTHRVQVWGVYVKPEHRGKGIAKSLMVGLLDKFALEPDIEEVILEVNTDQKSAQKLYERFDFTVTKTYRSGLGDGKEHEISEMSKSIK